MSTVPQLKKSRKSKKGSLKNYNSRINKITKVIANIDSFIDDDVKAVNHKIQECMDALKFGLKGPSVVSTLTSNMESVKQKASYTDDKVSSCRSQLVSEKLRCQQSSNNLEYEVRQLENEIQEQGGTIYPWE